VKQKTRAKDGLYTYDDANRLSSTGYAYDGAGRRIRQTVGANTTNYLLDVSMGLWETLTATTGANVNRYVHDPRGLLSHHDGASWDWMLADDLGSVRNVVDGGANVLWSSHYAPYDSPFGGTGSAQTAYGFTGEPTDGNGLVYLRNRYYAPGIGVFASVDPLETANRYAYVGGNVVNATDPSGLLVNPGSCPSG
jgi:RHS repeat-associated protein